jgi:hypothetical protein
VGAGGAAVVSRCPHTVALDRELSRKPLEQEYYAIFPCRNKKWVYIDAMKMYRGSEDQTDVVKPREHNCLKCVP